MSEVDSKIINLLNYYRTVGTLNCNDERTNKPIDDNKDKIMLPIKNLYNNTILSFSNPTSKMTSIFSSTPQTSSLPENNDQNINNKNDCEDSKDESNKNEKGDLAVVLYDFNGTNSDELILQKDEYLIVTNWNVGDGWAFGYKKNDFQKKGKFPYPLVRKCSENEENESNDNNNNNNKNINNNTNNTEIYNNNSLPTYEESVNTQSFINATSSMYQNPNLCFPYTISYNPSFIVPPIVENNQYTVTPTTQSSQESFQYVSIPPSPYDIPLNLQPTAPEEI